LADQMCADAGAHGHDSLAERYADSAREVSGAAGMLRRLLDVPVRPSAQAGARPG
jgi:hypothetical protein